MMIAIILAGMLPVVAAAQSRPPLGEVAQVTEPLITAAIAYEIGRVCGPVNVRMFRGIGFLNGIKSTARGLGYSNAEIDAFVNDRVEKRRLEDIARARLRELGAVTGQPETYCAVGRSQMAAGSQIGRLLY